MANVKPLYSPAWMTQLAMALCGLVAYGYNFSQENVFNQMPAVMALLDPTLYSQDFYVQEMMQFTPRSYYYYALALPVKLGLSLPVVCFIYFAIAFTGFSLGLYALGRDLGQSKLSAAVLAFLGLAVADGTVGYTDLFRREPLPSIYAMGIAIWGIYFCLQQRWIRGYVLFGLSCLLQILIGVLPGLLLTPALIVHSMRTKRPQQVLWAWAALLGLAGLVYSPMVLTGTTSSDLLSGADFVWLYGHVRHPHHIIMSVFSVKAWWRFVFFFVAGLACVYGSQRLHQHHKVTLALTMVTGCCLLAVGYGLVELYPVATVVKLQLARTSPFILLMVLVAIAVYASEHYHRGNRALALCLIVAPVIDNAGPLITLTIVMLTLVKPGPGTFWQDLRRRTNAWPWASHGLFLILLAVTYPYHVALFLGFSYPFLRDQFPGLGRRLRLGAYTLTALCGGFVALHLGGGVADRSLSPIHRAIKLAPVVDEPVKTLAVHVRDHTPVDALVLVPPSDRMFRFYSQRSVVVNFKGFPFTDAGIVTWQQRMEDLLGDLPAGVEGVLDQRFSQRTGAELGAIATQYGATHILTRQDWHPDIPGTLVEQQGDWVLWAMASP
ncbi:DUF6798 domain-containing protein [Leptothoe sp. PORK10 BA2]|uniref:DUF6798 domain-containing protein n=1 Tax=Leptothoe sp. PORK10 BA2 TaxID=3110254 RepID=UPI002B1FABD8|nr:DUF6798 domain-containing protein [Leptothoe sp. PORK10 BA2]MEA5466863.1 DUF6798 domain-containing protein [Leptothoe sp. PORK10 BA2]